MTMRAMEISTPGGPEVLVATTRPIPEPGPDEVIIRVAFAGVNRPDLLQRAGSYAPPPGASDLPGLECSGWIDQIGANVSSVTIGQEVCALLPGGGYSEYVATPAAHVLPVPDGMTLQQAACLPETFFTVWSNLFMRGGLSAGERFLVHGGCSFTAAPAALAPPPSNWRGRSARGFLRPPAMLQNVPPVPGWAQSARSIIEMRISSRYCAN